ncbi:uncharacterized protein GIQ15_05167 [Arthroderma uncinatum]|uniref:uncharacterized protein n=1 Tax=Arthroderma uncinatum TaxID=74035 RepID=UPI00144ADABF|nr:uncharacterized protein GIQ15_05167 [Arthroderma uncinatum]KAF3482408.1 hypothetical protein GIQ15_05167 [Arthroderma uncinatum]
MWVFASSNSNRLVREAAYKSISTCLTILGPTLTKPGVSSLAPAIQTSCCDLLPPKDAGISESKPTGSKGKSSSSGTTNADAFLDNKSKSSSEGQSTAEPGPLTDAATFFLLHVLTYVPTELIPLSLRAKIDRTSILTANEGLVMASVLNPISSMESQRGHSSILPFLARSQPKDLEVEGLLRPRMPVIITGAGRKGKLEFETDDEDDEAVETSVGGMGNIQKCDVRESLAEKLGGRQASASEETTALPKDAERGNKRRHQDDVDNTLQTTFSQPDKRVRVEDDTPMVTITLSDRQTTEGTSSTLQVESSNQSSSGIEDTAKMNFFPEPQEARYPTPKNISEFNIPSRTAQSHQKLDEADTDSDDGIPQLNMESDTDEDDEE